MDIRAKITLKTNFGSTVIDTATPPAKNPLTDWILSIIQPKVEVSGTATVPGVFSQDGYTEWKPYGEPTHDYTPIVFGFVVLIIIGIILWKKSA